MRKIFRSKKEKSKDFIDYIDSMFVTEKELKLEILHLMKYIDKRIKEVNANPNTPTIEDSITSTGEEEFNQHLDDTQVETNQTQDNDESVPTNPSIVDAILNFLGIKRD